MKKIMTIFGTRPEAIKMCPLVLELKKNKNFEVKVCVTGQHKEMLDQVLTEFGIIPDYNLNIMKTNQTLAEITSSILLELDLVLEQYKPDLVLVHGDTTTTYASALSCFYKGIKIGHVEAGLRTWNIYSPFPEEFNRKSVSIVSDFHFAPTESSKKNLLGEGINNERIFVTGNTVIDALKTTVKEDYSSEDIKWASDSKIILLTAHRRENWGKPLKNIFSAVNEITKEFDDVKVIYPMHLNPKVRELALEVLGKNEKVRLIDPLEVFDFHNYINKSYLIITDSGGIQEEAPSLGKPVLVVRDTTERPEGIEAGTLKLIGTNKSRVIEEIRKLLNNNEEYEKMAKANNPYGDGNASKRISEILGEKL